MKILSFSAVLLGLENIAEVPGSESRPGSLPVCKTSVENSKPGLMVECEGLPSRAAGRAAGRADLPQLWLLPLDLSIPLPGEKTVKC